MSISARHRIEPFAALSFLLPLCLYLVTLAPTVTFFDSGEFITAVYSLGTAHSPGYPLFINYAKPFTYLPFGSVAFRVNMATAVSAALACYGVYFLTRHLLKEEELSFAGGDLLGKLAALAAALCSAGTARLWLQSNHDKPYPLLSFICIAVFFFMLRWRDSVDAGEERPAFVYLGAFLCGVATGAHQTVILMIPAFAFLLVSKDWRVIFRVKEMVLALAFGILGFAVNLHPIVRALQKPLLNWGDSRNLTQFLWNILRKGYPVEPPVRTLSLLWRQVNAFNVPREFTAVGLFLLIFGLAVYVKRQRDLVLAYIIALLSFLVVIVGYFNTPGDLVFLTEEFFTPLYLLSAAFIGVALFTLARWGLDALPRHLAEGAAARGGLVLFFLVFPVTVAALHFTENDQHDNYVASDYAENTLRPLPQGAVLFTWGDSGAFPLWYLQGVERLREDLDLLHTPHLVFGWYLDGFPKLFGQSRLRQVPEDQLSGEDALQIAIAEQMPLRPVFVDFSTRYSLGLPGYQLYQRGIDYQLLPAGAALPPPDLEIWNRYALRGIYGELFFRDLDTGKAIQIYATSLMESGQNLMRLGGSYLERGATQLCQARRISPEFAPQVEQSLSRYGAVCR